MHVKTVNESAILSRKYTRVVSLGAMCATKYQVMRTIYYRREVLGSKQEFQKRLIKDSHFISAFGSGIFDWQITPAQAVNSYFRSEFTNTMMLEDLDVPENGATVLNRRLQTQHPHDFKAIIPGQRLTLKDVELQFPKMSKKRQYLESKMRDLVRSDAVTLYVAYGMWQVPILEEFVDILETQYRDHDWRLLLLSTQRFSPEYARFERRVVCKQLSDVMTKPVIDHWQGDDYSWDQVLGDIILDLEAI